MTPDALPPGAIDAGLAATLKRFPGDHAGLARDDVAAILQAAAPHLATAEREACAQLAEQVGAIIPYRSSASNATGYERPFAALLRGGGEGGGHG